MDSQRNEAAAGFGQFMGLEFKVVLFVSEWCMEAYDTFGGSVLFVFLGRFGIAR